MKKIIIIIAVIVAIPLIPMAMIWDTNPQRVVILDEDGVALVDYGGELGLQRNPAAIGNKASVLYSVYIETGNLTAKQQMLNNANWLVDNAVHYGNYSLIEYTFPWESYDYDLPSPWRSGLAQGHALRALINAHDLTGDQKYLDGAKPILNSFFIDVKDGGVTLKTKDNGWWFEEYAHEDLGSPRVLNGMISAVLDIHEYYLYTNDTDAKFLFDQGVTAVKNNIANYDLNDYSYYDNLQHAAPANYHLVHVVQTQQLYDITGEPIFLEYSKKWDSCEEICQIFQRNFAKLYSKIVL